jgi:hypothetical protein
VTKRADRPVVRARMSPQNTKIGIIRRLSIAFEKRGADEELPSTVGCRSDTLNDAEILSLLCDCNATGKVLPRPTSITEVHGE